MKYTLEIQKRLLQVENGNLSPHEKALLLKEAIRIADENDVQAMGSRDASGLVTN